MMIFVKESVIGTPVERVFAFHELPDALERLTPTWESARVVRRPPSLAIGSTAVIETRLFGFVPVRWVARHTAYDPPRMFEDVQVSGPFKSWRHRHLVSAHADGATLRDEIVFEPPLGALGRAFAPFIITPRLQRMFDYRHQVTRAWCEGRELVVEEQVEETNRDGARARGWLIAAGSLALIWGFAFLKGRVKTK